jgi:hypothetical protein
MSKVKIHPWIQQWAVTHCCSPEVAQAIHDVARDGWRIVMEGHDVVDVLSPEEQPRAKLPEEILRCPDEVEVVAVFERAWELADDTVEALHWGEEEGEPVREQRRRR